MMDLEFWRDYYIGRKDYRSIRYFWLNYFDGFGFRKSQMPSNANLSVLSSSWYYREGFYLGYYSPYEEVDGETIMWELNYGNLYLPVSTSGYSRVRKDNPDFRSVPEVLWVLD